MPYVCARVGYKSCEHFVNIVALLWNVFQIAKLMWGFGGNNMPAIKIEIQISHISIMFWRPNRFALCSDNSFRYSKWYFVNAAILKRYASDSGWNSKMSYIKFDSISCIDWPHIWYRNRNSNIPKAILYFSNKRVPLGLIPFVRTLMSTYWKAQSIT